ncbi:hypothetical protein CNR22_05355 [Sphingobacteriaceae bacterium]|nr:hypothetical protein CNR22_05355 [Sphingobacteriaceae bacterium]
MITRKLLLVFGFFFILNGTQTLLAQMATYPIILNEYCVSNTGPIGATDEKGVLNDYVELYCNHTQSISLANFYLTNDRVNLKKWKFPSNFPVLQPQNYYLVWLSGKNTNDGVNFHTNFNVEQCKNQWIIISNASGVVYDSIFVLPTKGGHVRGRVDYDNIGNGAWKLFTSQSPKFANGTPAANGYAPKPNIFLNTQLTFTSSASEGVFIPEGSAPLAYIRLQGNNYDSTTSCYNVFYTKNGDYPVPFYDNLTQSGQTYRFNDSLVPITLEGTTMIRAIAVPKLNNPNCPVNTLPSFCETNTYFIGTEHNGFSEEFGVISIALDKADTAWFNGSQGAYSPSVHVEYYDKKKQISEGYGMMTRPPQEQWITSQKGFYIHKDDRLGSGCDFEGDIFNVEGLGTTPRRVFPILHVKAGDYESHSGSALQAPGTSYGTGIRDIVMQSIAAKNNLNVSPLHIKPVVAFVNGAYWGVYDLREVYDKYYEQYYNGQSLDSLDLNFVVRGSTNSPQEGYVTYWDGSKSSFAPTSHFNTNVYDITMKKVVSSNTADYQKVMANMDKASFIDFMALNSYAMNSDLWTNNIALAKGGQSNKNGGKWHFYLWNMPSIFNYTAVSPSGQPVYPNYALPPCYLFNAAGATTLYVPTSNALNGHGNIMTKLMRNPTFKAEYIARYQDLLNGPLKCENIIKQLDYVAALYSKEMKYHEDPASAPLPGKFPSTDQLHLWDTNVSVLRKVIQLRCFYMQDAFKNGNCFGLTGPFNISVDVRPKDAGSVQLNTTVLPYYTWYGEYHQSNITFKGIPASSSDYKFHHWEIDGPIATGLSSDSIVVNWNTGGNVVAVFTDKRNDISSSGDNTNIPSGFTPNGDGLNDDFRPLGSAEFATEYQMTIFNRWGQEVFRTVDVFTAWDGRFRGQDAQTGVYAYFISYRNIYNEQKLVKGNVTLTR